MSKHPKLNWPQKSQNQLSSLASFKTIEIYKRNHFSMDLESHKSTEKSISPLTPNSSESWKNRLILGDNKFVLTALLDEFQEKVDLIYIDPPFATGGNFSYSIPIGDGSDETIRLANLLEEIAYHDTWGQGNYLYLQMLRDRLRLMRKLLSPKGSLFLHIDWHMIHYLKVLLDEIFGPNSFQAEIIWKRTGGHHLSTGGLDIMTDSILWYSKSDKYEYHQPYEQLSPSELKKKFPYIEDATGRRFTHEKLEKSSNSSSKGESRVINGKKVTTSLGWVWTQKTFDKRLAKNPHLIYWTSNGRPRYKRYADEYKGRKVGNLWTDISPLSSNETERVAVNYPTQKPEALLRRIINMCTSKGDLIADFFCGSGTTGVVADLMERRWIMSDFSKFALHTTTKRLLDISNYHTDIKECFQPFMIQKLQDYQRFKYSQHGIKSEKRYYELILSLINPEDQNCKSFFQGQKGSALIHIVPFEKRISQGIITECMKKFPQNSKYSEIQIYGRNFAYNIQTLIDEIENKHKIHLDLKKIPLNVEEIKPRNLSVDSIRFYSINRVYFTPMVDNKSIRISLDKFRFNNWEFLNSSLREKITDSKSLIDYWGIDFNFHEPIFHPRWHSYRTGIDRRMSFLSNWEFSTPGVKQIMVKIVDIFGNECYSSQQVTIDEI